MAFHFFSLSLLIPRTSLTTYFLLRRFNPVFVPAIYDALHPAFNIDGTEMEVSVWDTPGAYEYQRLRSLVYPKAHVILMCFAVNHPSSLDQVQKMWLPEVRHHCPDVPLLLVGLKKDLRQQSGLDENEQQMVSTEQAMLVAQQINAHKYFECSAKTGEDVDLVFEYAARMALEYTSMKSGKRCIVI